MVKELELTQGQITLIDDEDFEEASKYKWNFIKGGYAYSRINNNKIIYMHQFIMKDIYIDHIDGNKLNNQKSNLRKCTCQQNAANKKKNKKASSKYKGVYFCKARGNWEVEIKFNYKKIKLGRYKIEEEAAKEYDLKARELFGEFARCNFDLEGNNIVEYI